MDKIKKVFRGLKEGAVSTFGSLTKIFEKGEIDEDQRKLLIIILMILIVLIMGASIIKEYRSWGA